MENNKKENLIFFGILGIVFILIVVILILVYVEVKKPRSVEIPEKPEITDSDFSMSFIKNSNRSVEDKKNYMISPYSVEIALSMLRDGSDGETFNEINNVVPKRDIKIIEMKKHINVANGLFVKNTYKDKVLNSYVNTLKNDYNADIVYDKFTNPTVMNNWVKKETYGMINKLVDKIDDDFVLGLVNAVAMDAEWENMFSSEDTYKKEFNLASGSKLDVSMMHKTFSSSASYYEDNDMKSIVLPYKKYDSNGKESDNGEQLEFIGILPNGEIDDYIDKLSLDTIKSIDEEKRTASGDFNINLNIPKFKFDYDFEKFKNTLIDMGISSVFSSGANLSKMLDGNDFYVNDAIHKSHIEFDEKGTKAAAVTGFMFKENAMIMEDDFVEITFDKPFVFAIKDVNSSEILFFGVVYEPSKYEARKD